MKRREFLVASAAIALVPLSSQAREGFQEYSPGLVKQQLDAGKTVFIDFSTDWCSTCASQERTIQALREENSEYNAVTFIRVDWDLHSKSKLAESLKIPRRSPLVVLKGNKELGRIVAGTKKSEIKKLLDTALSAAMV